MTTAEIVTVLFAVPATASLFAFVLVAMFNWTSPK